MPWNIHVSPDFHGAGQFMAHEKTPLMLSITISNSWSLESKIYHKKKGNAWENNVLCTCT